MISVRLAGKTCVKIMSSTRGRYHPLGNSTRAVINQKSALPLGVEIK